MFYDLPHISLDIGQVSLPSGVGCHNMPGFPMTIQREVIGLIGILLEILRLLPCIFSTGGTNYPGLLEWSLPQVF